MRFSPRAAVAVWLVLVALCAVWLAR